jgi:hypothetical protein
VDTKKKELVGDFKNAGRAWQRGAWIFRQIYQSFTVSLRWVSRLKSEIPTHHIPNQQCRQILLGC